MANRKSIHIKLIKLYGNRQKIGLISKLLWWVNRIIFNCDFPGTVKFGANLDMPHHGLSTVVHPRTKIGNNVTIYHNVTIGTKNKKGPKFHCIIEDNVLIGTGSIILGNGEFYIGSNSIIAAGSVVIDQVPKNVLVAGNPAKIVKKLS